MNVRRLRSLQGPNSWAACPVIEAALDLREGEPWSSEQQVRATAARLGEELLGGGPEEGGAPLLSLARTFSLAALKLQDLAGNPVSFATARPSCVPGLVLVAVEFT